MIPIPYGVIKWFRTGSSYTCDPPVRDTDYDIVAYVRPQDYDEFIKGLLEDGWEMGGSRGGQDEWSSFKKAHDGVLYNLLVTKDDRQYDLMGRATALAKHYNLLKKEDRIILFHAVVDGILPVMLEGEKLPF